MSLDFDVLNKKKVRVILDTDAACEADDPFAIVHALMSPKLVVKAIFAEQFGSKDSTKKSYESIIIDGNIKKHEIIPILRGSQFALKNNHSELESLFVEFLFNMINHLYETQTPSDIVNHFGLQETGKYAIGERLINDKGEIEDCDLSSDLNELRTQFREKGDFNEFNKIMKEIFSLKSIGVYKLYILNGLASPILDLIGKQGSLNNIMSDSTGIGKSTSQMCIQLAYRNKITMEKRFTHNAVIGEMGLLRSIPCIIDEITSYLKDSPEMMSQFAYDVTTGSDKKRMDKNSKQKEVNTYYLNFMTSSNRDFLTVLNPNSLAEMVRVLQYRVEKKNLDMAEVIKFAKLVDKLKKNSAWGYYFISKIMENRESIEESFNNYFEELTENIYKDTNFRYQVHTLSAGLTFAHMLSDLGGWGVNLNEIKQEVVKLVKYNTNNVENNLLNIDKVMNSLLTLPINYMIQEPGKSMAVNKDYPVLATPDAYLINTTKLIIPKAIFDSKVCQSSDKRFKPLFQKTTSELIEFINENSVKTIATISQINIQAKRTNCVIIELPSDYCAGNIPLTETTEEEIEEMTNAFNNVKKFKVK